MLYGFKNISLKLNNHSLTSIIIVTVVIAYFIQNFYLRVHNYNRLYFYSPIVYCHQSWLDCLRCNDTLIVIICKWTWRHQYTNTMITEQQNQLLWSVSVLVVSSNLPWLEFEVTQRKTSRCRKAPPRRASACPEITLF